MGSASHSSKRKKKRSQKHSKKRSKSIREKPKKLKRRHDSVSCSSEDMSASTSPVSRPTSSLEDNCRSRKRARSRDRKDRKKGSKKRIKRDSSMSDNSEDSLRLRIKKRKASKKKGAFDSRKKRHGKKRRRELSSSSSADEGKRELDKKEDESDIKGRDRVKSKGSRYSLRRCSPCSSRSESHSYGGEERVMEENPPKRLKSIIVAMRELEEPEAGESNRDEHKDEIDYEHDDYPSRSNDSNDGMSRGGTLPSSHDASDEKAMELNSEVREVGSSDTRTSEKTGVALSSIEFGVDGHSNGNRGDASTADAGSSSVDLESMLRLKALQNLLKRQGKLPTKLDGDHHSEVNEQGGIKPAQKAGKNEDMKHTSSVSRFQKGTVHPQIKKLETKHPLERSNTSTPPPVISKPKLSLSTSTRRLLGPSNTWRRDATSQGSPRSNPPTPKEIVNKDSAKAIESKSLDSEMVTNKSDRATSSEPSPSERKNKKDEINEADDDSEFEQKTMTVMRGGELVQVSYKVKIPKKAPALARRQLKR